MQEFGAKIKVVNMAQSPLTAMTNSMKNLVREGQKLKTIKGIDGSSMSSFNSNLTKSSLSLSNMSSNVLKFKSNLSNSASEVIRNSQAVDMLKGSMGKFLGVAGALFVGKKFVGLSDELTGIQSRLGLIVDKNSTVNALQGKIFSNAQNIRGSYMDLTNTVAKLNMLAKDSFTGNDEALRFANLLQKSFKLSGAGMQEQTAGMYQITQAMASGRLQGDEFRSVIENAPLFAQAIAKYTGKSMAELKKMSSEGKISSDIMKNAIFSMSDDINNNFAKMPMTVGDYLTQAKNVGIRAIEPLSRAFNGFMNSSLVKVGFQFLMTTFENLGNVIAIVVNEAGNLFTQFSTGIGMLKPILPILRFMTVAFMLSKTAFVQGLAQGVITYTPIIIGKLIHLKTSAILLGDTMKLHLSNAFNFVASGAKTMATRITTYMSTLNFATMFSSAKIAVVNFVTMGITGFKTLGLSILTNLAPLLIISALLGIGIIAFQHLGLTANDVLGFIGGAVAVVGASIYNTVLFIGTLVINTGITIINLATTIRNWFVQKVVDISTAMTDGSGSWLNSVGRFVNGGIGLIEKFVNFFVKGINLVIEKLNALSVDLPTPLADLVGMDHIGFNLNKVSEIKLGRVEDLAKIDATPKKKMDYFKPEYKNLGDSFNAGKSFGKGLVDKFKNPLGDTSLGDKVPLGAGLDKDNKDIKKNTDKTAKNTDKLAKTASDMQNDNLKYLTEVMTRREITRLTLDKININLNANFGDVHETADTQGILEYLGSGINETMNMIGVVP